MIKMASRATKVGVWAALISILVLATAGWVYYNPLLISELKARWQLHLGGVRLWESKGTQPLHGYIKDDCGSDRAAKGPSDCTCIGFIHELGDNALSFRHLMMMRPDEWMQAGLAGRLKLVAVNLPGTGGSLPPSDIGEYRVRTQAKRVIKALGSECRNWIVVGSGVGGWIAAWMALEWNGVSKLVLLSPGGQNVGSGESYLTGTTVESLKAYEKRAYAQIVPHSQRVWQAIARRASQSSSSVVMAAQVPQDDLNLKWASIGPPMLILWGMSDQVIPLSVGHQIRDQVHSVVWREVPKCGHLPQQECPSAVVQSIVDMAQFGTM